MNLLKKSPCWLTHYFLLILQLDVNCDSVYHDIPVVAAETSFRGISNAGLLSTSKLSTESRIKK